MPTRWYVSFFHSGSWPYADHCLDSRKYVEETTKPSTSYVRTNLCLLPGDSSQQSSKWKGFDSCTLFATSEGHPIYKPPGNKVSWKPPSKATTLLEMEPVQSTEVVTSLPSDVDLISCVYLRRNRRLFLNQKYRYWMWHNHQQHKVYKKKTVITDFCVNL